MSLRNTIWMVVILAIAWMLVFYAPRAARRDTLVRNYRSVVYADSLIRKHFIDPIDARNLAAGAVRGMAAELDPYSGYLTDDEMEAYRRRTEGEEVSVGAEFGVVEGRLTVIAALEGGPASRAGVHAGDVVLSVGEQSADDMTLLDLEQRLAGPPGTEVEVRLLRPDTQDELTVRLAREATAAQVVKGFARLDGGWAWMIDRANAIGYVRISYFNERTVEQFDAALASLRAEGMRGLVLDLRNNPGGVFPAAVDLVDRFVADGLIVTTRTREESDEQWFAEADGTDTDTGLVVLVDGATASAAEVAAGSLQDRKRARLVGVRTFGKGSVQTLMDLGRRRGALRLTYARYRLPSGRSIDRYEKRGGQDWGVVPDVVIELTAEESDRLRHVRAVMDQSVPPTDGIESFARQCVDADRQLSAAEEVLAKELAGDAESQ